MTAAAATSDPRATDAAIACLKNGGNAVDAAATAALVLYVVEPQSCGIGGDGFMLIHDDDGAPIALDGSGAVPAGLTTEALAADGMDVVPGRGAASATVPGAMSLLEYALANYGTISLADAIAPALAFARDGFEVRSSLAVASQRAVGELAGDSVLGPLYAPNGEGLEEGVTITNPALADALTLLAEEGASAMLSGSLGASVIETIEENGGYLSAEDLRAHETTQIEPASVKFGEHTMWQMPAPTQGPAVLAALREVESTSIDWSASLDAMRAGMIEAGFDPGGVAASAPNPSKGDTTFLAAVDSDGRAVSLITSVFGDFGSQLGVPALGGPIHNRAAAFRLVKQPVRQGKPPHTTIPGMITGAQGEFCYAVGVAGGIMQPQTQVQLTLRTLIEGLDPQDAINQPRFKICFGGDVALEEGHPLSDQIPDGLAKNPGPEGFGAAQMIGWHDGELKAGADPRRGGSATVID